MRNFLFLWALSAVAQDPWAAILTPLKLTAPFGNNVLLPGETAALTTPQIEKRLQSGSLAILEGDSEASRHFGFHSTGKNVTVTSVATPLDRALQIVWEQPSAVPIFELPGDAIIFATERWQGAPLVAGLTRGAGAILWVALSPGNTGRERYPFLPQALAALGIHPPVTSQRLWLFFDSSYRLRADPDYLARRWRANGVAAMHIAAWHYFERDEGRDAYLRRLLDACHRNGIAAYAWLELPHVSETFWRDHPEWREKTALGQDAHLDWRMLMNLRNAACAKAVRGGVEDLLRRFDWDGVNLAELYFESLEGHHNASRFTPMNDDVRGEFRQLSGIDPVSLFDSKAEQHWSRNPSGLQQFLTYRAGLATRMQQEWIETLTSLRKEIPHLDLVLTHVDDFLEPGMKEKIGADAARVLPIADAHGITFLVEDPAPLWNQGPSRYTKLGAAYAKRAKSLAADINVVERYQDVYPTRQQTGVELAQEIHAAAAAFPRVTLYFETSIRPPDWPLLGAAAAAPSFLRREGDAIIVHSPYPVGVRWKGPAQVGGVAWPAQNEDIVWLPAGEHKVEPCKESPQLRLLDLNANLTDASAHGPVLHFAYDSQTRAYATLSKLPKTMTLDGKNVEPTVRVFPETWILVLPRGQHIVTVSAED